MSEKDLKTEAPVPFPRSRPAPEDTARWHDYIFLPWAWRIVRAGAREPLVESDLFDLGRGKSTAELAERILVTHARYEAEDAEHNASLPRSTLARRIRWRLLSWIGLCAQDGQRRRGLGYALNHEFAVAYWWWGSGPIAIWAVVRILLALVSRWLIRWCTQGPSRRCRCL